MAKATAGEIVYKVTGDTSQLKRELQDSTKRVEGMGSAFTKLTPLIAGAFAVSSVISFGKAIIKAASDAIEVRNKFDVVYSTIGAKALKTANDIAAGYNLSKTGAQDMLASTGNVLESMGFGEEAALKYSASLAMLGADLTSYTNFAGGSEEATRILTKAILGEREALQSLGFKISEQELIDYAAAQGKVYSALTQRGQAELTMQLILKKNTNAQGDVNRSIGTYAYELRRAENNVNNFNTMLGSKFVGSAAGALSTFSKLISNTDAWSKAIDVGLIPMQVLLRLVEIFTTVFNKAASAAGYLGEKISQISDSAKGFIQGTVFEKAANAIANEFSNANKTIAQFLGLSSKVKDTPAVAVKKAAITETSTTKVQTSVDSLKILKDKEAERQAWLGVNQAQAEAAISAGKYSEALDLIQKRAEKMTMKEKFEAVSAGVNTVVSGMQSIFSSLQNYYSAATSAAIASLDAEEQRALEAAGVADSTAVQSAELKLAEAEAEGDAETIAEAKKALTKAKIEEQYEKKKAQTQYKGALQSWELQRALAMVQMLQAPLNAYVSSLATPIIGPILAPINAAIAAIAAGIQYAAVVKSKPSPPAMAVGGIVPATSSGTEIVAGENNKAEIVANQGHIEEVWNMMNGKGGNAGQRLSIYIGSNLIYDDFYKASTSGEVRIDKRAIV